ncbi:Creatinase/Aminopeptidase P [Boletus edulis BED1]|uniref:Creatinase/Aminopeptidase P n=1 Tax=Boletus edulis BED1 TaxID=1328754 RepID=A0AAD4GA93_BOLED|nr:Creatinase/Aminopeptidase P [Boletus edulis BED1]
MYGVRVRTKSVVIVADHSHGWYMYYDKDATNHAILLKPLDERSLVRPRNRSSRAQLDSELKPSNYGQPLFHSHPHLLRPHELTPGIPVEEYEQRRRQLMENLPNDSVVVSVAAPIKYMSGKIFYKFRQASDFWYLTGFEEPDVAVILEKTSTSRGYRMTLFSSGKDSHKEKWDGARTSFNDASSIFKADDAQSIQSFPNQLKSLASIYSNIYFDVSNSSKRSPRTAKSLLRYLSSPVQPRSEYDTIVESLSASRRHDLAPHVAKLRAIKSEREQQVPTPPQICMSRHTLLAETVAYQAMHRTKKRAFNLKAGMVITVEPGIYVPPVPQFPKAFHNMGVRIDSEDEVLVGKNHPVVLSVAAPKEIVDVEGACQGQLGLEPPRIFSHLTPSTSSVFSICHLHGPENLLPPQPFVLRREVPAKESKDRDSSEDDNSLHSDTSDQEIVPTRITTHKVECLESTVALAGTRRRSPGGRKAGPNWRVGKV